MGRSTKSADLVQAFLIPKLKTPKEAFRDIRNYLAGQAVGATRDDFLLDELLKCLFCNLYIEIGAAKPISQDASAQEHAQHMRTVFEQVQRDFSEIYEPGTEILLDDEAIGMVMAECAFSLTDAASDPIGDAFEVFVGSESRSRAGQFFTPRSVTDLLVSAVAPQPGETVMDPACGAGGFLTSVARYHMANGMNPQAIAQVATTFYGIDKDEYLAKLAKLHVSLLTGGHPHIICGDSLAMQNGSQAIWEQLPKEGFDVILTNPPFGARIVAARPEILKTFELARKWKRNVRTGLWEPTGEVQSRVPPQVLFIERCLSLLKPGGRFGMVVPESLLSNKSYRYVVEYLLARSDLQAVIGMPDTLFKTSGKGGTHTKTCLLIATKSSEGTKKSGRLFMAEAKWCGQDSRARSIPNNDLPTIAANLGQFQQGNHLEASALGFAIDKKAISSSVLCPRYYDPQLEAELDYLSETHDLLVFGDLVKEGVLSLGTGDEVGKLAYGTGDVPFIRTSDISNWELKADPKHCVSQEVYKSLRRKQDVQPCDLLMVRDGTYLIGTCAIVTDYDTEILYQSHIYKIRVHENSQGINPFLLLAALSSPIVQRQIRSKQFTQDIIDSLGDRINELVLPVPKAAETREKITQSVKAAVYQRIEARRLAKEAITAVAGNSSNHSHPWAS